MNSRRLFKSFRLFTTAIIITSLISSLGFATTRSWIGGTSGTNNWNTASNWTGSAVPTLNDTVIIGDANFTGGNQPAISSTTVNNFCDALFVGTGAITSTLTIGNANLTVDFDVTIGSNGTIIHSNTSSLRSFIISGNWVQTGMYNPSGSEAHVVFEENHTISGSGPFKKLSQDATTTLLSNITVNSALTIYGTFDPSTFQVSGTGSISVDGTLLVRTSAFTSNYNAGTVTANSPSVVEYARSGDQTVTNSFSYDSLKISGSGTKTSEGNLTIAWDLNVTAGTLDLSTFTANGGGTLTVANGATLKIGGTNTLPSYSSYINSISSIIEYSGTTQTISSAMNYGHLKLSASSGTPTKTAGGGLTFSQLTIGASTTFNASTFSHSAYGNITNSGTLTGSTSTITVVEPNASISGSGTYNFNNLTVTASGVTMSASTNATIAGNLSTSGSGELSHISGGSGTITMSGSSKTIFGTGIAFNSLTTSGSISTSTSFSVEKDFNVSGSFSASSGTITFNGTSTLTGSPNLNNVTLNGTSLTMAANASLGIAGALTLTSGTFDATSNTPNTVNYKGSTQTVASATYYHLTISTSGTKTAGGNLTVNGDLTVSAGTLALSSFSHTFAGYITVDGALDGGTSSVTISGSGKESSGNGTLSFNNLTLTGIPFYFLQNLSITGNFTNNIGSLKDNGKLPGSNATFTFSGSSNATIGGNAPPSFPSLIISKTSASVTMAVHVAVTNAMNITSGTFDMSTFQLTNGGTLTIGNGATLRIGGSTSFSAPAYSINAASTVEYYGSSAQTITTTTYGNLTSSGSGARTFSGAVVGIAGTFTTGTNTYTTTGSTIDFTSASAQTIPALNYDNISNSGNGNRTLASSGTIQIAGTFSLGSGTYTTTGSTVDFNGSTQNIPALTYNNLTTSGSGTKTLSGNATVNGNLTLSAGSFADGGNTLTVKGDIANSVTHSGTGKIILSGGSVAHALTGGGSYTNVELNDVNGATVSGNDFKIDGTLTLTSGNITTTSNKTVKINSTGSISRTSGHVVGLINKYVSTGSPSLTYEIGTSTDYLPVDLTVSTVSVAGAIIMGTTTGDHSEIGTSNIRTDKSVNRYWTMFNNGTTFATYNATFNFLSGDKDAGANSDSFMVQRYNGTSWSALLNVGTRTGTSTQVTGAPSFSSFGYFQIGIQTDNPVPTTTNISPTSKNIGESGFTMTVHGTNFVFNSVVRFNGSDKSTTVVNDTTLTASILSSDIDTAGAFNVTVFNPAPVGGTSNAQVFSVVEGTISGKKYNDNAGDSAIAGDATSNGWLIKLYKDGILQSRVTTSGSGDYSFTNLTLGTYTVEESLQISWKQTFPRIGASGVVNTTFGTNAGPRAYSIVISAGTTSTGNDFGNFQYGSISGMKFNDLDGDGTKDDGENGLEGWKIRLAGAKVDSATTDGSGNYTISNLSAGVYTLTEVQQSGWTQTTTNPAPVTITSGLASTGNNFGNFQLAGIFGTKFNDLDADGVRDDNEPGLQGWTINITGPSNSSTSTDVNGGYQFTNLQVGTYTVSETQQSGWVRTKPSNPGTYVINVTSGGSSTGNDFGNFQLGTISGVVYNDVTANAARDLGDDGLASWRIYLYKTDTLTLVDSTLSSQDGYSFSGLNVGAYFVREKSQSGWVQTTTNPSVINVTSGANITTAHFGNFQLGTISGKKFNDVNANGAFDDGEPGLSGWTIQLSGVATASTTTDGSGNYSFTGLSQGEYTIGEVTQVGWVQTTPGLPGTYTRTVNSGTNSTSNDFGNIQLGSIAGSVFGDVDGDTIKDGGENGLSGWKVKISGPETDSLITDGSGNYLFDALPAGSYTLSLEIQTGWKQTLPSALSVTVQVNSGQSVTGKDFGVFQYASISGMKFRDGNGNGVKDGNDAGIQGWKIRITGAKNDSTLTNAEGNYTFSNLIAGNYTVSEAQQSGWTQTFPTPTSSYSTTLTSGESETGFDFGNYPGAAKYRTFKATSALATPKGTKLKYKKGLLATRPNLATVLENVFKKIDKKGTTFLGIPQTVKDSAKRYAWIYYKKGGDLAKLYTSAHGQTARPLDQITSNGKVKKLSKAIKASLPVYDNIGFEQGVLFRLNIIASDTGVTTDTANPGRRFGDLILDTNITVLNRELRGTTLRKIATYFDSINTYYKYFGDTTVTQFTEVSLFVNNVLRAINERFSATLDSTNYLIDSVGIVVGKNPYSVKMLGLKTASEVGLVRESPSTARSETFVSNPGIMDYPEQFTLYQNYPNPFNPTTNIKFYLETESVVTIRLFDVLGREVVTLLENESLEEGEHELAFDASKLSSGVYFYNLVTNGGSVSELKKMLLLK
ncbi:MAG: T9SS type A sorting domain-containing protein [Ignavibacteriales bacterium]|nr:T9SS type A sorting domain-containing protein [Ignavibacteriales bacterium]